MQKLAIAVLLCLVPVLGCRGQGTGEGKVPIRRVTSPPSTQAEIRDSTQSLGEDISALLDRFQDANSRYASGEITRQERTQMAVDFEQDAWGLVQVAKGLADKAAKGETEPKRKAFKQELELFLLLYLEDLNAAFCAERVALETNKAQWNKRARLQTQPLLSLANSIRWKTAGAISLRNLSPPPGKLPSPTAASKQPTAPTEKATAPARKATPPAEKPVTGD